ncbi:MAG: mannitol dehydrogenase family protein [Roseobacter sp.]
MNGIVHIGTGAFHRAHQAVYTQDATTSPGTDWAITGISLRSAQVADALNAQNGRYTLVIRSSEGTQYQVINSISGVLAAQRGMAAIHAALARPETRIISLTITEKGYAPPFGPDSAITLLIEAFKTRKANGLNGVTLLSCDNLSDNGAVLQKAVMEASNDAALSGWITEHVSFPSTMVDRITPATTPELLTEVATQTGWADQVPVVTESFSQWVIQDSFVQGRPLWETAGAQLVSDVAPYEKMKLRMLNGAHSMLAYAGHLAGKTYVRDVMADPILAQAVARHMDAAAATLDSRANLDPAGYRDALLMRFRNPHIAHETYQIAMDGSQKMPQRIFEPAQEAAGQDQDLSAFAFATAAWAKYLRGIAQTGVNFDLRDPREDELAKLPNDPKDRIDALFTVPDLVPSQLGTHEDFKALVVKNLKKLDDSGVIVSLKENLST